MAATKNFHHYEGGEKYWQHIDATVDGMLGGLGHLSPTDIRDSDEFIKILSQKHDLGNSMALDCGAGIGRITKELLFRYFELVDMVDVTKEFLDTSPAYLGPELNARVQKRYCEGLQSFSPIPHRYDLIWCQWVLGHLTDDDFVAFFRRCKQGLKPKTGWIVVKENCLKRTKKENRDYDEQDHSYCRSRSLLLRLFDDAGLTVVEEKVQSCFPKELYEVRMFALR